MKKVILILILVISALSSQAQFITPIATPAWYHKFKVDQIFWLATSDTTEYSAATYPGALVFQQIEGDTAVYYSNGVKWVPVVSTPDLSGYALKDSVYFKHYVDSVVALKIPLNPDTIHVSDSIWLNGKWVKGFSDDSTMGNGDPGLLPSQRAVKGALSAISIAGGAVDTTVDINSLENYDGSARVLIVTDTLRGGIFYKSNANLVADSGIIFNASGGGFWIRDYNIEDGIYVTWFGAKHDSLHDDTRAIQQTINYVAKKGGGVVFFPNGKYLLSGSLTTDEDGLNPNSQLYIPNIPYSDTAQAISIVLKGQTPPNMTTSGLTQHAISNSGAILISGIDGTGTDPAILGGVAETGLHNNTFTNVNVYVRNLTFRVKADTLANGPTMSGINAMFFYGCNIDAVRCDIDVSPLNSVYPTNQVFGIRMPTSNNAAFASVRNCQVAGFRYGYLLGEHTIADQIQAKATVFGITIEGTPHSMFINRASVEVSNYAVAISGPQPSDSIYGLSAHSNFRIMQLSVEPYDSVKWGVNRWYDYKAGLIDNYNRGHGDIYFEVSTKKTGLSTLRDLDFTKVGGQNINCTPITIWGDRLVVFGAGSVSRNLNVYQSLQHQQVDTTGDISYLSLNGYRNNGAFNKDDQREGSIRLISQVGRNSTDNNFSILFSPPNSLTETNVFNIDSVGNVKMPHWLILTDRGSLNPGIFFGDPQTSITTGHFLGSQYTNGYLIFSNNAAPSYKANNWKQIRATSGSSLLQLQDSIINYYTASPGRPPGTFSAFWGSAKQIPIVSYAAPASSTDVGTKGEIRVTTDYIYVCIATNTWVRAALSTW